MNVPGLIRLIAYNQTQLVFREFTNLDYYEVFMKAKI